MGSVMSSLGPRQLQSTLCGNVVCVLICLSVCLQLKEVRSLFVAGVSSQPDFQQHLRSLELCFRLSVQDLRSQVVREACITIA